MKVLVIGREGQVARSLAERSAGNDAVRLQFLGRPDVDLAQAGSAARAIAELRPDAVINAAAYTNVDAAEDEPELAFQVNAEAAGEIAAASAAVGAPMIHLSTDYVFDGMLQRPYREGDAIHPLNIYGSSKAVGEERVRSANPHHLILRTSWIVSPIGRNFVKTIVDRGRAQPVLKVVDDQHGRPTPAIDLADAMLAMLGRLQDGDSVGRGETYHVAGSGEASWFEVAREVVDECGRLGLPIAEVQAVSTSEWPTKAARPAYSVLDCSRFEQDFGYALPEWRFSVRTIVSRIVTAASPR